MKKNAAKSKGTLVIIGGHEDKEGDCTVLQKISEMVGKGKLVIATVASEDPGRYFAAYKKAFAKLGNAQLREIYFQNRSEALDPKRSALMAGAKGVFFSGGDQLRISSQMSDTPFERAVRKIFDGGGVIAGTSAGASVMAETMLVRGHEEESYKLGDLRMAPGLGLIEDVIIDQHFAERGRIGRLLGAVAFNPRILGVGIDEDTAIIVKDRQFEVIGKGAVYVVDGASVTYSNIAEGETQDTLSLSDVKLHVLSAGDQFNLAHRRPTKRNANVS